MPLPDVHFFRSYYGPKHKKGPTVGQDVIALKLMMNNAGYFDLNQTPDRVFNSKARDAFHQLQKDAKIIPATGNVGPATFEVTRHLKKKGSKTDYAWGPMAIKLFKGATQDYTIPSEAEIRGFISDQLYQTYLAREYIDYSQDRGIYPVVNMILNPRLARKIDCSGEAIYGGFLAYHHFLSRGVRVPPYDPIYGNSGYGNTYSLIKGGTRTTASKAKVGDLVFYTGHVSIVVNTVNGVNVVSMGSNPGPLYLPYNYRNDVLAIHTYDLREVIDV